MKILTTITALALLGGCAGIQGDGSIGTVRIPTEKDCQFRQFQGVAGGGLAGGATGTLKTFTVTGPTRCSKPETIDALKTFF